MKLCLHHDWPGMKWNPCPVTCAHPSHPPALWVTQVTLAINIHKNIAGLVEAETVHFAGILFVAFKAAETNGHQIHCIVKVLPLSADYNGQQ